MLRKTTAVFAHHGMPLECDIYAADGYPQDTPVFLYFHPGGLVDWGRDCVPPWLVQVCYQRKWPLISPSYRLLPQSGAKGLLEDVSAAYEYALKWDTQEGQKRHVIAGGASGGVLPAALIAHHCKPPPLAIFSISGINTFRHPFFNSSTQLTPEPIPDEDMAEIIAGPVAVGVSPPGHPSIFYIDRLLSDGSKNLDFQPPQKPPTQEDPTKHSKGELYDYYTYKNAWLGLVGEVDPGYAWAKDLSNKARVEKWPQTVIFHGNDDWDVPLGVSEQMRDCLGADKVVISVANGQQHLFEGASYIDDVAPGMDAVREAVGRLDDVVNRSGGN